MMKNVIGIRANTSRCGACGICELACAYHHTGFFNRHFASIEIFKNGSTGDVEISFFKSNDGIHYGCDLCDTEERPLCIKWCPVGALRLNLDK
ncbi:MAG: hypothetical protein ACOC4Y_02170 [bacterium]